MYIWLVAQQYEHVNMAESVVYDCIVVGAGIEGSATAYQLAKRKHKTLLLEQVGGLVVCYVVPYKSMFRAGSLFKVSL